MGLCLSGNREIKTMMMMVVVVEFSVGIRQGYPVSPCVNSSSLCFHRRLFVCLSNIAQKPLI